MGGRRANGSAEAHLSRPAPASWPLRPPAQVAGPAECRTPTCLPSSRSWLALSSGGRSFTTTALPSRAFSRRRPLHHRGFGRAPVHPLMACCRQGPATYSRLEPGSEPVLSAQPHPTTPFVPLSSPSPTRIVQFCIRTALFRTCLGCAGSINATSGGVPPRSQEGVPGGRFAPGAGSRLEAGRAAPND